MLRSSRIWKFNWGGKWNEKRFYHCDDGTGYTITDVSRYDKNYFASGPVGPLPEPTCDRSQFDQPELPKAEARHFNVEGTDYLFVRNLYETRRMLYTLYNIMGEN